MPIPMRPYLNQTRLLQALGPKAADGLANEPCLDPFGLDIMTVVSHEGIFRIHWQQSPHYPRSQGPSRLYIKVVCAGQLMVKQSCHKAGVGVSNQVHCTHSSGFPIPVNPMIFPEARSYHKAQRGVQADRTLNSTDRLCHNEIKTKME